MDYGKLIDIGSKVSLAVVLIAILYLGSTGVWTWGSQYKEMVAERDQWRELALKGTKVAQDAALRAAPITGPPAASPTPLPTNPSPAAVARRLEEIKASVKYPSEPTDAPL